MNEPTDKEDQDEECYVIGPPSREQIEQWIKRETIDKNPYTAEELRNAKPSELQKIRNEFREDVVLLLRKNESP